MLLTLLEDRQSFALSQQLVSKCGETSKLIQSVDLIRHFCSMATHYFSLALSVFRLHQQARVCHSQAISISNLSANRSSQNVFSSFLPSAFSKTQSSFRALLLLGTPLANQYPNCHLDPLTSLLVPRLWHIRPQALCQTHYADYLISSTLF